MSFEGKNLYGQYIDYSEKKNGPTGTIFYNIRIYSRSRSQVSVYRTIGPLVFYGSCTYIFFLHLIGWKINNAC